MVTRDGGNNNQGEAPGIFSVVFNRGSSACRDRDREPLPAAYRWPTFSMSGRSFWTKYCLLCTICGSAATILAGIFLVVAALFRYYTTSIYYFETVPTYIPAILLSICGVSTIAFSCKRNRNIILLRITACWSLVSAALSSVITITTSLIHMNRLQTLKECVYNRNPPSCTCFGHSYGMEGPIGTEPVHYVFENTSDCDVIHGALYSCLRAVFAISVVAVLLSIFLCMLLYQLIGHERKKAYWSRIRRINSDWSSDFLACLARPLPRERSSMMPLMLSASGSLGGPGMLPLHPQGFQWGPPPPYEPLGPDDLNSLQAPARRPSSAPTPTPHNIPNFIALPPAPAAILSAHPFSPTITSVPGSSYAVPILNNLRLRDSKISIDSDSDNLSSVEEEATRREALYEPKLVNVHVSINRSLSRNSSSNFDFLEKGLPEEQGRGQEEGPSSPAPHASLPSSPFLSSMKRIWRGVVPGSRVTDRANSLPGTPRRFGARRRMDPSHSSSSVKENDQQLC